jgi:signal transduction histidine kinase/ligand-binding sensor domain-containing protein/DNA-binding NarL/FixJ family response regulator
LATFYGHSQTATGTTERSASVRALFLAVALLSLTCLPAASHNGAVALAHPVTGLTIDGDLSDWPEHIPAYPIALPEYGPAPTSADDFKGYFRLAYSESDAALYVAMHIVDDEQVLDSPSANWDAKDGSEVFLNLAHGDHSAVRQFVLWGNGTPAQRSAVPGDPVFVRWHRGPRHHDYEWRFDVGDLFRTDEWEARSIGADFAVGDVDPGNPFSWLAWGPYISKVTSAERLGDVVFVRDPDEVGRVRGRLRWAESGTAIAGTNVRLQAEADSTLWVNLVTRSGGEFRVDLPAGSYAAEADVGSQLQRQSLAVVAGDTTVLHFDVPPTDGTSVALGPGRLTQAGRGLRQGPWHTYGVVDGVEGGSAWSIVQDSKGVLWFGTRDGLHSFDGVDIRHFGEQDGLLSRRVRRLWIDPNDALWIGTDQGLTRKTGDSLTHYTPRDGLIGSQISALRRDAAGDLWIATDAGLSQFDGERFLNYTMADGLAGNNLSSLAADDGHVWIGSHGGGLSRWDGEQFQTFDEQDGLPGSYVNALVIDADGVLWIGTENGLGRYADGSFTTLPVEDERNYTAISALLSDSQGDLWMSACIPLLSPGTTTTCHARRLTSTGTEFWVAPGSYLREFFEDREGGVWSANVSGLARHDGGDFAMLTIEDGLGSDVVRSLLEDDAGSIWIGTSQGVSRFRDGTVRTFAATDGLSGAVLDILQDALGHVWMATASGAFSWDGDGFTRRASGNIIRLAEDDDGSVWMKSGNGVLRHRQGHIANMAAGSDALGGIQTLVLHPESGVWITSLDAGLTHVSDEGSRRYTAEDGFTSSAIEATYVDNGQRLWLATQGVGITVFDGDSFVELAHDPGLLQNVRNITQTRDGTFWFSTNAGVVQYDGFAYQSLLQRDGLAGNLLNDVLEDRHGDVWIGGTGGVTRYRPRHSQPPISITDVVTDEHLGPVESVHVTTADALLALEFRAISFKTRPDAMRYRYRLAGLDDNWQLTETDRVEYDDLPVGSYTFEVQGIDRDLNYSAEPARVAVTVALPILSYAQWIVLCLAVAGLAWQTVRIVQRNRRLTHAQVELAESLTAKLEARELAEAATRESEAAQREADALRVRQEQGHRATLISRLREAVWQLDSGSGIADLLAPLAEILHDSGIGFRACGVNIIESETEERVRAYTLWEPAASGPDHDESERRSAGSTLSNSVLPAPLNRTVMEMWRGGEVVHRSDLMSDDPLGESPEWSGPNPPRSVIDVPFSGGTLAASSPEPHAFTPHLTMLGDLAEILTEGFRRLEDLQALRDRTEYAEKAQRAAESANRSKSAFLANMSHEIRTPMNAILGFADVLNTSVTERQRDYVQSIQSSSRRLLSLVNDILDLSKVESDELVLELRPADVHALFRDVERGYLKRASEKGVQLTVEFDENLAPVLELDEHRLRQILNNLVSNAVKFTEQGEVTIRVAGDASGSDTVDLSIQVADTGIGIPKDQHERIFAAFEQSEGQSINEYGGTGIGLALTNQLVALMQGEISMESRVGEGSTFVIHLPGVRVSESRLLQHARPVDAQAQDYVFSAATILVADDEVVSRELIKGYLEPFGFDLLDAEDGEIAVRQVRARQPDLVLMDLKMPGMDGFTAAQRLKADATTSKVPLIALTAAVMRESDAQISQVFEGVQEKPLTRQGLTLELARFLPHDVVESETTNEAESSSEPDWAPEDLTAEQLESVQQLIASMLERNGLWETLSTTMAMDELEDFAAGVGELAQEHGYPPVATWAQNVASQAVSFDMVNLTESLAQWPALIEQAQQHSQGG